MEHHSYHRCQTMSTINNSLAVQERVVFVENNRNDLSFNTLETFGYGIEFDGETLNTFEPQ